MTNARLMLTAVALGMATPLLASTALAEPGPQRAQYGPQAPDFPDFADVSSGFTEVDTTDDGERPLYRLWVNNKTQGLLAELPRDYAKRNIFIGWTISGGRSDAGVQTGDLYANWKRFGKRIALIEPNIMVRTTGDRESRAAANRVHTDRVVLDVPILCMGPNGGPVIDASGLFLRGSTNFFGRKTAGARTNLAVVKKAKAFPSNTEIEFELPDASGRFMTLAYSLRDIPKSNGYKPRTADQRIGYFTTSYRDIGDPSVDTPWNRVINRWHLEKADSSLEMSPPKEPIVFYLESTTPVRYRRWVRDGVLEWNKAFEKIGIVNAIEVYQQDAVTGAHMKKDPEDARYNFILWTNGDMGYAIGPSRTHPVTGQILDADVVMDEGFVSSWVNSWEDLIAEQALEGFGPSTLAWLEENPQNDPRVLLANPGVREQTARNLMREAAYRRSEGMLPMPSSLRTTHRMVAGDGTAKLAVEDSSPLCMNRAMKSMDIALMRMDPTLVAELVGRDPSEGQQLDGVPEWYIGPMLKDVIMHEVGHTLGLRHNFKASGIYDLSEMHTEEMAGRPISGSVMDYLPVNINMGDGHVQGPFGMVTLGPYDYWAIEFGYGFGDPLEVAKRCADPMLAFATDEDTFGPDPMARRFDNGKNSLDYAASQVRLVTALREELVDRMVKDGEGWSKARDGYSMLLGRHVGAVSIAGNWIGGSTINRDRRGDPGDRRPIESIPADQQRRALEFVLENTMHDECFGLTPELLHLMTVDKWFDEAGMRGLLLDQPLPVHDTISGVQGSVLTMVLNPGVLNRVYDNEFRGGEDDMLTVPEVLDRCHSHVWRELDAELDGEYDEANPCISSRRRNLQRSHIERLLELAGPENEFGAVSMTVATLGRMQLRRISDDIESMLDRRSRLDAYTVAHLEDAHKVIERALDPQHIYNTHEIGGSEPVVEMRGRFGRPGSD
jgi:hypothetical protein